MNYEEMSDQQINLKIVKIIYGDINHDRDIKELWHRDRFNYCNDPKNWGKLMQDNKISCSWEPDEEGGNEDCWEASNGTRWQLGHHKTSPGRAVSICYLKMKEANNG